MLIIITGAAIATGSYIFAHIKQHSKEAYQNFRASLGHSILLGLEFLVAADIINTVVITPTLESVGVLAVVVLIRTFLSFALEVEIEGRLPWQHKKARTGE